MVDPDDSHSNTSAPDLSGKMTLFELASNPNSRERGNHYKTSASPSYSHVSECDFFRMQ
jgi:hypothetical protein